MSTPLKKLEALIRELIKKELDEASVTGNLDGGEGPPQTPIAFKKKKKKKDESVNETKFHVKVEQLGSVLIDAGSKGEAKMIVAKKLKGGVKDIISVNRVGVSQAKQVDKKLENVTEGPFSGAASVVGGYDDFIIPKNKMSKAKGQYKKMMDYLKMAGKSMTQPGEIDTMVMHMESGYSEMIALWKNVKEVKKESVSVNEAKEYKPEKRRNLKTGEVEIMKGKGSRQKWFYLKNKEEVKQLIKLGRNSAFPTGITNNNSRVKFDKGLHINESIELPHGMELGKVFTGHGKSFVKEEIEPAGNMAKIQKIVKDKQATKLGGVMIDMQSANLLMKLWDAVSDKDKEKMNKLNPKVLTRVIEKLWSRVNLRLPI